MPELKKFDYFFLRYVPRPTMDDYVTFGVVMLEDAPNGFAGVRFVKNWRRLQCAHPEADLEYLRFLEQDIRQRLSDTTDTKDLLARMEDCFSGSIQTSPYKQYLAEEPQAALDAVARGTLDIPLAVGKAQPGGKRRILRKIQAAFEAAGIWRMIQKNIPAERYTYPGDPLKIDVAYRPNGVIKMLQALSLEANVDAAKALAFSYPQLVAGIDPLGDNADGVSHLLKNFAHGNNQIKGTSPITRKKSFQLYLARKKPPMALTSAAPKRTPVR